MAVESIASRRATGGHGRSIGIAVTVVTMAVAALVLGAYSSSAIADVAAVVFAIGAIAGLVLLLVPRTAAWIPADTLLPFAAVTAGVVIVTGVAFLAGGGTGGGGPVAAAGAATHAHDDGDHEEDHDADGHGDDHDAEGHDGEDHAGDHDTHDAGGAHGAHDPGHDDAHDPGHGDGHDPGHGDGGGHDPGHGGGGGGHDPGHGGSPGDSGFPDHWTDTQVAYAKKLIADTEAALAPWSTTPPAGMNWIGDGKGTGGYQHWINTGWWSATLNPSKPGSLVYRNTGTGIKLEAAMYVLPSGYHMGNIPSDIAWLPGWHIHDNLCFSGTTLVGLTNTAGNCPAGSTRVITPPMLHVWIVDTPCGRFAGVDENGLQCNHEH